MTKRIFYRFILLFSFMYSLSSQGIPGFKLLAVLPNDERPDAFACVPVKGGYAGIFQIGEDLKWSRYPTESPSSDLLEEIDLKEYGIFRIRELRPYHRFADEWTVFFIGADQSGNEGLYGMDFGLEVDLPWKSLKRYDTGAECGPISAYEIYRASFYDFYALVRSSGALQGFYVFGKSTGERIRRFPPPSWLCRRNRTHFCLKRFYW